MIGPWIGTLVTSITIHHEASLLMAPPSEGSEHAYASVHGANMYIVYPTELQDDYAPLGHTYRLQQLYPPFLVKRRKKLTVRNEEERIKERGNMFQTHSYRSFLLACIIRINSRCRSIVCCLLPCSECSRRKCYRVSS